mmetsp:Transcript_24935/g.62837  ORF Transcript_24935/g.62837 Transcript_24935/m.62837 type:complete len:217 (+) Transcript_24935:3-653(+)
MSKVLEEVDRVVGDGRPGFEDIAAMPYLRATLAESLRLYPQPPILIRRALSDDVLPGGLRGDKQGYPIGAGADIFISVWNLHHSPYLWKDPEAFNPDRFSEAFRNPEFDGAWAGYTPDPKPLYPNEVTSDFAFIPFGGGMRKCVGDQFALTEAAVALAMIIRRFSFKFATSSDDVGMATGATIHTANGLNLIVSRRDCRKGAANDSPRQQASTASK